MPDEVTAARLRAAVILSVAKDLMLFEAAMRSFADAQDDTN